MEKQIKKDIFGFIIALVLLLGFSSIGCEPDCEHMDQQCNGDDLELCNSKGEWETTIYCAEIDLRCCVVKGEPSCWEKEECGK